MAGEYEVLVHDPDGTLRATLTPEDAIDALAWSTRGDGDMGEALIRGKGLDLRPRDIVAIKAKTTPTSGFAAGLVYLGWVVQSHDTRAPDVVEVRLTSGSSRLADVVNTLAVLDAGDVAALARQATETPLPAMIEGWPFDTSAIRLQTFELGNRYPRLETLADTLEALAASVPGFTVPTGESYTYGVTTYTAGQEVPATRWGLRKATGLSIAAVVFFDRPDSTVALDETADQLTIEWGGASSDGVVDRVHLVLFDAPSESVVVDATSAADGAAIEPAGVEYAHPGSSYHVAKRVDLPPLEGLTALAWGSTGSSSGWVNAGNATDGNDATYARNDGTTRAVYLDGIADGAVAVKVRYSTYVPINVAVRHGYTYGGITRVFALPTTEGQQAEAVVLCPRLAPWLYGALLNEYQTTVLTVQNAEDTDELLTADVLRVYEVTPLQVDTELLERIAAGHVRLPVVSVARVTVPGRLNAPSTKASVTLADGSTLDASVEAVECRITRGAGFETIYHLNQELPIDQARARALGDRRAARATAAALRARA